MTPMRSFWRGTSLVPRRRSHGFWVLTSRCSTSPATTSDGDAGSGEVHARFQQDPPWRNTPSLFTPADSAAQFDIHVRWLERALAKPYAGSTVVITHHAPSRRSIHPRFADSLLNACFVSDAERLLDGSRARLWIHGHTHDSFDYALNGTRVVCNPRGYVKNGVNENPRFDPNLVIEVD